MGLKHVMYSCAALFVVTSAIAQPSFPNFTYYVPAIAEKGGPVYVIPGVVTQDSIISFPSVSGQACEQSPGID